MRVNITSTNSGLFRTHESHSPDEVLATGGATAFGRKSGKNNQTLILALKDLAPAEPFSEEEWKELLEQLESSK